MNLLYNSEHYSVLAYPQLMGFELLDKSAGRILFLHGPQARHFRLAIEEIPETERDEETIDAFLDGYCTGEAQPIVFH
jgi:hypothetical protein